MPAQQQTYDDTNPPISQAVQIWGEGPEIVPYAAGFIPPTTFLPGLNGTGSGSVSGSGTGTASSEQVPESYDLHWVAGDTAEFDFFFDGVCWTPVDPGLASNRPDGIVWEQTAWEAQVRSGNYWYYGYWWPPVWPGYWPTIAVFHVSASFVEDFNGMGAGTMVSLNGGTIWPGSFVWDLQTTQYPYAPADVSVTTVRTWLSGKAIVDQQVTQNDLYPPSNWPVYPYP